MKQMIKIVTEEENLQKIINVFECKNFFYTNGFLYLILPLGEDLTVMKNKLRIKKIDNVFIEVINDKNYNNQTEVIQQEYKNIQLHNDLERLEENQQEYLYNLKQKLLSLQDLLQKQNQ